MTVLHMPEGYRPKVSIRKRADRGIFFLDYDLPPQRGEDRVRQRLAIPAKNKKEAEFLRVKKQETLWRGEFEDADFKKMGVERAVVKEGMTLSEFLPTFKQLRERGHKKPLSPLYLKAQDRQIERHIEPKFGSVPLADITAFAIDDFIKELSEEEHPLARPKKQTDGSYEKTDRLSSSTINHILGHLSCILTIAQNRNLIAYRPRMESLPSEHDEEFDFLEKEELLRLLGACQGSYGNLIKVIALTGMRAMEACGLQWQDYDAQGKRIHVERQLVTGSGGKTKSEKIVPRFRSPKWSSKRWIDVSPALARVLKEQAALTRLNDGLIFFSEKGNPVVHELLRRHLRRTCRRGGLRVITPHVLRRTYISHRIMAGDNPVTVQRVAGHKSITVTTKFYTRLGAEFTREAASKFDDYLFGKSEETGAEKMISG